MTVEFRDEGGRTTVVLTHRGLRSEESRDGHAGGWSACLDNLSVRVFPVPSGRGSSS